MKKILFNLIIVVSISSCNMNTKEKSSNVLSGGDSLYFTNGYSDVNGIKMYYEIYGEGKPLVLLHGGGSTIQTSFGRIIPPLSKRRKVIGVELQAHGRTGDRNTELSFEQDADDVAALMKNLKITKADFLGFSNGGTTTLQIAVRHPEIVDKIIMVSALFKRSGAPDHFWEFMNKATIEDMPQQFKDEYKKVAADPSQLQVMHDKCAKRMVEFKDVNDSLIRSVKVPALIVIGDRDVSTPEHATEIHRMIEGSRLAIVPGGHGDFIGEISSIRKEYNEKDFIVPMIEKFLNE